MKTITTLSKKDIIGKCLFGNTSRLSSMRVQEVFPYTILERLLWDSGHINVDLPAGPLFHIKDSDFTCAVIDVNGMLTLDETKIYRIKNLKLPKDIRHTFYIGSKHKSTFEASDAFITIAGVNGFVRYNTSSKYGDDIDKAFRSIVDKIQSDLHIYHNSILDYARMNSSGSIYAALGSIKRKVSKLLTSHKFKHPSGDYANYLNSEGIDRDLDEIVKLVRKDVGINIDKSWIIPVFAKYRSGSMQTIYTRIGMLDKPIQVKLDPDSEYTVSYSIPILSYDWLADKPNGEIIDWNRTVGDWRYNESDSIWMNEIVK